jgi:hypothetical protein
VAGTALELFRFSGFLQALVQIGILSFQQSGYDQIIFPDFGQINLFNVYQSDKLSHRPWHASPTFIARSTTLGDANLAPEIMLIKAKFAANLTRVGYFFKELHDAHPLQLYLWNYDDRKPD